MKKILIIFLLFHITAYSQDIKTELYGFKIGQIKKATHNELGKPFQTKKYDDGFEAEVFLIKPDSSAYIVFEYNNKKNKIWSIQLYDSKNLIDPNFNNLSMGDKDKIIIKKTNVPDNIIDIGEYGKRWEYIYSNYTLEVNDRNKLTSIKIINDERLLEKPNTEQKPDFKSIKNILLSNNIKDLKTILSPELTIVYDEKEYFIENSWDKTFSSKNSKIFRVIDEISKNLKNNNVYKETIRISYGKNIQYVMKLKNGENINEIIFKYYFGKYLIYKFNF